jgi:hypothetical protein
MQSFVASLRGLDEFQIEAAWETSVSWPRSGLSMRPSDFDLVILSQTSLSLSAVWHLPSRGPNSSSPRGFLCPPPPSSL